MSRAWKTLVELLAVGLLVVVLVQPDLVWGPLGRHPQAGLSPMTLASALRSSPPGLQAFSRDRLRRLVLAQQATICTNTTTTNCTAYTIPSVNLYHIIFAVDCATFDRNATLALLAATAQVDAGQLRFVRSSCGSVQVVFSCLSAVSTAEAEQTCGRVTAAACAGQVLGASTCGVFSPATTTSATTTATTITSSVTTSTGPTPFPTRPTTTTTFTTTTEAFLVGTGPSQGGLYGLFGLFGLPVLVGLGFLIHWLVKRGHRQEPMMSVGMPSCTTAVACPLPQPLPGYYLPTELAVVGPTPPPSGFATPAGGLPSPPAGVPVGAAAPQAFAPGLSYPVLLQPREAFPTQTFVY